MGYGEVVGNASVHWSIVYEDTEQAETGSVRGRDPIRYGDIGTNKRRKLTKGTFRVRMMFKSKALAERAREAAEIVEENGSYFLQVRVPVVNRKPEQVNPPTPPAEVRVDW